MLLFFCGDVMLGRAVDQIFEFKNKPQIYESYYKDARCYIPKTMLKNIQKSNYDKKCNISNIVLPYEYIWGDLLKSNLFIKSKLRIINLETSITTSTSPQDKSVLYKMHPKNINAIKVANIDYCSMANNHVLDWKNNGLIETIDTLNNNNLGYGGIGKNINDARKPYMYDNIMIFSMATPYSGTFKHWKATENEAGVNVIDITNKMQVDEYIKYIKTKSNKKYMSIVSVHWGGNWGYNVSDSQIAFAHRLIDDAGVGVVHGHSSHHFKKIEVYKNKLIMYGCGDMINDYETIKNDSHKKYMSDVNLAYYPYFDKNYNMVKLLIKPYTIKNMRLVKITNKDKLTKIINRINKINNGIKFKHIHVNAQYKRMKHK